MKYERFSELWKALVINRSKAANATSNAPITNGMSAETASALIDYSNGKKDKIQAVRKFLATAPAI